MRPIHVINFIQITTDKFEKLKKTMELILMHSQIVCSSYDSMGSKSLKYSPSA